MHKSETLSSVAQDDLLALQNHANALINSFLIEWSFVYCCLPLIDVALSNLLCPSSLESIPSVDTPPISCIA
jgi:hypothetical protein